MRCSTSLAVRPVYCQTTLTTGILIDGKMSVGVRIRTNGVSNSNSRDATTKVYGRRRAKLTIHISFSCVYFSRNGGRKFHGPFQSLDFLTWEGGVTERRSQQVNEKRDTAERDHESQRQERPASPSRKPA